MSRDEHRHPFQTRSARDDLRARLVAAPDGLAMVTRERPERAPEGIVPRKTSQARPFQEPGFLFP
jgi:hypothetical protein